MGRQKAIEPPHLVAEKLQMLLEDFGPVKNDPDAAHIVSLAIALLSEPVEPERKEVPGLGEWIAEHRFSKTLIVNADDARAYITALAEQHKAELADAREQIEQLTKAKEQQP